MSVNGNQPAGTYHARGLRQCLEEIDRWAKKAASIAAETGDGWMLAQMAAILDAVGMAAAEWNKVENERTSHEPRA